jgi:pimeloyl-ACP methyl ester carboxylesterase
MRRGRMSWEFGTRFCSAGSASVGPALLALACACSLHSGGQRALADRVEMADGRVLEGRFVLLSGVAIDPTAENGGSRSAGTPILMCDDELTRTMVSKRRVVKAEQSPVGMGQERIPIPQRVPENGRRVTGVGGVLETTPFDEFGRRIFSIATATGRVDVVQGITEITPQWTSVAGIVTEQPYLLDMRIATSSIPREVLRKVIDQHIDRTDADQRLRVVRLYLQAERYDDARQELDEVLRDFPDLADLRAERRSLGELAAAKLLDEILLRGGAGQDRLAMQLLESFPADDAGVEVLEAVREARDRYRDRQAAARRLMEQMRARARQMEDGQTRGEAEAILDEIERELSFATLDRLATFERLGTDPAMPADRGLALAISGWLQGSAVANENLKLALSAARVRALVREYLVTPGRPERDRLLVRLEEEDAFDAVTIAAIARQMRPPQPPPAATAPGLHEIEVPGLEGEGSVRCLVQLPPEYDPLRRYPAILSLHAGWSTPLNQIEWWAGMPGPDGLRRGQATRHGAIVIAPAWGREHQTAYEYSAREHAAVLGSLRESLRRFSIDSDRVFLSGHSMGGDAAWDIALAHPDLWAGLVAIVPSAGKYVHHYWRNAASLPVYIVGGELDNASFSRNSMDLDRLLAKGYDATYVEYRGRGHEHFSDEIVRLFDWMARRRRTFFPSEIDAVTMRPWDRFFWWVEMAGAPPKTVVLPAEWPPASGTRPLTIEARTTPGNTVAVHCGADRVRIWLSPELIDFSRPVTVTLDGRRLANGPVVPDTRLMLEDLRSRADRQHPFWAVVESAKNRPETTENR